MLVVVHDRYAAFLLETAFHLKAFRSFYVFEVDAAESGRDAFDDFHEFSGVFFIYFDVECVKSGEYFEKEGFPLHDRLSGERPYVAEAKHCGAVGNDAYKVAFIGVSVCVGRILFYFEARICHTGGIGEGKIMLRTIRFRRHDFNLSRSALFMIFESQFFSYL